MPRRPYFIPIIAFALLLAACAVRLNVDGSFLAADAFIQELRGQRLIAGLIVGSALAVSGVLLQCLMRNPLASPDLLGLASGSSLAIMLWQYAGFLAGHGIASAGVSGGVALLGAFAALAIVYLFAQRRGLLEPVTLILVGVVVAILCSALSRLVQAQLPDRGEMAERWLMGSISDETNWRTLAIAGSTTLIAVIAAAKAGPAMDAASLGDDEARSVGVRLNALRLGLFIGAGLLTAAAITLAGPIGFVGLICPHLVRATAGPRHRPLVISAALVGGALVIGADALVRVLNLPSGRLPIGVLTTLLGAPLLVWMLRRPAHA